MRIILLLIFCFILNSLTAQEEKHKLFNWTRTGVFGTWGIHFSEYAEVNKMFTDSSYLPFETNEFPFGIGFTGRTDRVIFYGDYYFFVQCNTNDKGWCSHIDYKSYGISFGFDVTKNNKLDLYPTVGVYRSRTDILLSYVDFPVIPFSQHLLTNSNITRLTRWNFNLNLGAGLDYFLPLGKTSSEIMIGLKAGYFMHLNQSTWYLHVDEEPVSNPPKVNPGGAYVKTVLGICF